MTGKTTVLSLALLTAVASAQWLETTITVGHGPFRMCYCDSMNKTYCSHPGAHPAWDSSVMVIDGTSNQVIDTVIARWAPTHLCANPLYNKVYCTYGYNSVAVIDATTDSVLYTLEIGSWEVTATCYNTAENKVYFVDMALRPHMTIVDGETDSILACPPEGGVSLCYNPQDNKVYSADWYGFVTVIDGAADTVVKYIAVGDRSHHLVYSPADSKVYCACDGDSSIAVIDGGADSVVATVFVDRSLGPLCYSDSSLNKVYCANEHDSSVTVIDCSTDSVVATIRVGTEPCALCYDPACGKVYCANRGSDNVSVIDCPADTVLVTIDGGCGPGSLCRNPRENRMYVANSGDWTVSVIRDSMPGGIAEGRLTVAQPGSPTMLEAPTLARLDCRVLDALGRDVTDRKPRLSPGVYFIHQPTADSRQLMAVQKVIVTR